MASFLLKDKRLSNREDRLKDERKRVKRKDRERKCN